MQWWALGILKPHANIRDYLLKPTLLYFWPPSVHFTYSDSFSLLFWDSHCLIRYSSYSLHIQRTTIVCCWSHLVYGIFARGPQADSDTPICPVKPDSLSKCSIKPGFSWVSPLLPCGCRSPSTSVTAPAHHASLFISHLISQGRL